MADTMVCKPAFGAGIVGRAKGRKVTRGWRSWLRRKPAGTKARARVAKTPEAFFGALPFNGAAVGFALAHSAGSDKLFHAAMDVAHGADPAGTWDAMLPVVRAHCERTYHATGYRDGADYFEHVRAKALSLLMRTGGKA